MFYYDKCTYCTSAVWSKSEIVRISYVTKYDINIYYYSEKMLNIYVWNECLQNYN